MEIGGGGKGGENDGGGEGGVSVEAEKKHLPEAELKVKRKMKTSSQLEVLEKTYAIDTYPSESVRADLSLKLGLTDRQLQMWFCHRRLKDRKPPAEKKINKSAPSSAAAEFPTAISHEMEAKTAATARGGAPAVDLTNVRHEHQTRVAHKVGTAVPRISMEPLPVRRFYQPPLAVSEQRAIKFVEAQLGEPLRENGPVLGMEFDKLPPGAFGAPIVTSEQQKAARGPYDPLPYGRLDAKPVKVASGALHEYQFLPENPFARHDTHEGAVPLHFHGFPNPMSTMHRNEQVSSEYLQNPIPSLHIFHQQSMPEVHLSSRGPIEDNLPSLMNSEANAGIDARVLVHPVAGMAGQSATPERRIVLDHERLDRKRKAEEARIAKEVEAQEKKMRKEIERQDIIRRKREEQTRKELERQDRERRKEEERLLREKHREEERCLKEQRREIERREKFLEKQCIRAEKVRLKEEMRREKEAARLKAANDKAAARKNAKESMELFDDEKLELMEVAASRKGLSSIMALDSETLDNLDLVKGKLPVFPPDSVLLKRPFRIQPWTDSEENISNLLMVWRFLTAFADVLGLWPFTLDELKQALHDSDPRLLGEIHLALLKCIIEDIEDVARATSSQSSAFNPLGGHPHIVEGAYAWGFDLLSWKRLLTPLTWPEVLRQVALSAGFGPKLTKRSKKTDHERDNESDDGAAAISNLRSGLAAENAVTVMQERGFSSSRRSRHRLTPGTVKYAAFHILSIEGSRGLSILEVADKIQRSGLRDLTTSKTPEASISAALSRDTKLFERTAPSTYCLRSPYRKDPSNADDILSAAREKVLACRNGIVEEEAEKEDLARDQESESDIGEDLDFDDLDAAPRPGEDSHRPEDSMNSVGILKSGLPANRFVNEMKLEGEMGRDVENSVNDECGPGEQWVRWLTEIEYADLGTEERLDALVAVVGVANVGNVIRIALEERLEAASALKKQMWAEAQLDRRRSRDEHISKFHHPLSVEPRRSPMMKNEPLFSNPAFRLLDLNDQQIDENFLHDSSVQTAEKSRSQLKALVGHRAEEIYVYRSLPLGQDRRRNRYWQFATSPSRIDPGSGRIYVELCNGIWRVIDSEEGFDALLSSLDVRGIREHHFHSMLQSISASFKESARSNSLRSNSGIYSCEDFNNEASVIKHKLDLHSNRPERNQAVDWHKDFEWLWQECFDSNVSGALRHGTFQRQRLLEICTSCHGMFSWEEIHCPICHRTYRTLDKRLSFAEHVVECERKTSDGSRGVSLDLSLPPRVRLVKAQLAFIEASIPSDAFSMVWSGECRETWGRKLCLASTADDLLQTLTWLEDGLKREFLSSNYETASEVLGASCMLDEAAVLPWIPRTISAVALRLMELDVSIFYTPDQTAAHRKQIEDEHLTKFPSLYPASRSSMDNPSQPGHDDCWADPFNGHVFSKRGRGRPRGSARLSKPRKNPSRANLNPTRIQSLPRWKGRSRGRAHTACSKARPSTTSRQVDERRPRAKIVIDDTPVSQRDDWNVAEADDWGKMVIDGHGSGDECDDDASAAYVDYEDEDNEGMDEGDDYYGQGYVDSDYNEQILSNGGGQDGNFDTSSDGGSLSESEYSY